MLKLEKVAEGLSIRLGEREKFFEPQLVKALFIALFLHGMGLFLFKVAPFHVSTPFVYPPINVEADQTFESAIAISLATSEEIEVNQPPPIDLIPLMEWPFDHKESLLIPQLPFELNAFQSLEEYCWPKWDELIVTNHMGPRIEMIVSGDLAQLPLEITDARLNQMEPIIEPEEPIFISYDVQVDGKTGELIWYDRTVSSEVKNIIREIDSILLNLRFSPSESEAFFKGTLNFIARNTNFENPTD